MIQFYNTLTKQKEAFVPLVDQQVSMYVCGPTVYNYIHIGNARSAVAFDTVRRYLEYRGYRVNYVSNFTDVDDKIIKASKSLEISPKEVADRFIAAFYEDTDALNIKKATLNPRVMDNIQDIIAFIERLIETDHAYVSGGDVYFRTSAFATYGQLSGQSIGDLMAGASERLDDAEVAKKENPLDFALWKSAKENEIHWHAPWGAGRPGWHIECSVMATKYLGDTIDIHAGGQDLTFPHHENEIAQSEAKTGKKFANYWLHNGFVTFDGEKMSKSLGNFVLVHDLLEKVDAQVLRFFLASAHYRKPLEFKTDSLDEAKANLEKFQNSYRNAQFRLQEGPFQEEEAAVRLAKFQALEEQFVAEMDDDVNAPNGLAVLYQYLKELNVYLEAEAVSKEALSFALERLVAMSQVFGLALDQEEDLVDDEILSLIEERRQSRLAKDFKRSDEIRDYLKDKGIVLDDTPQGTRFRRL